MTYKADIAMEIKEKLVAFIGHRNEFGSINSYGRFFGNTVMELMCKLNNFYKEQRITWESRPDDIDICPIITENNGYQHSAKPILSYTSTYFINHGNKG